MYNDVFIESMKNGIHIDNIETDDVAFWKPATYRQHLQLLYTSSEFSSFYFLDGRHLIAFECCDNDISCF